MADRMPPEHSAHRLAFAAPVIARAASSAPSTASP
jgi:hypothetical protein